MNREQFTRLVINGKIYLGWSKNHKRVNIPFFIPKTIARIFMVLGLRLGVFKYIRIP